MVLISTLSRLRSEGIKKDLMDARPRGMCPVDHTAKSRVEIRDDALTSFGNRLGQVHVPSLHCNTARAAASENVSLSRERRRKISSAPSNHCPPDHGPADSGNPVYLCHRRQWRDPGYFPHSSCTHRQGKANRCGLIERPGWPRVRGSQRKAL
jgi:hypothetical protein